MASAVSPAPFVLPVAATSFTCVRRAVGGGVGRDGSRCAGLRGFFCRVGSDRPPGVSTLGEEGLDVGYPHRVGLLPGAVTLRQVVWPPGAPAAVCLSLITGDRGSGLTGGRQGGWAAGWSSDHPAFPGAAELRPGHARPPVPAQEAGEEPQSQLLLRGRPRPWPWATHSTSFSGVPLPGGKPWKILLGWDRKLALI